MQKFLQKTCVYQKKVLTLQAQNINKHNKNMNTDKQIAKAAEEFAERWKGRGKERSESQTFWIDLLSNVFGVDVPMNDFITFEEHHMVDSSNFIDAHIRSTRVLIEQKSLGVDLRKGIRQSDGSVLTPFLQARKYVLSLPVSQHPRWIVTCNFSEFLVYDMEHPNNEPEQILLEDLGKEYYRLKFLVDTKSEHLKKEERVSMEAGEIVARIYDALLKQYDDPSPEALRWLNILCVRIVFCLYAEDSGVFRHDQFHDFLATYEAKDLRRALRDLFDVLNTPPEKRSKYLQEELAAFQYTNGGLFAEEIEIPQFTEELKQTLLENASLDFDWSEISPTIFGAVFESTLNPETRRSGGMHYTSIENIHKVIDPLFLNDLRSELDEILEERVDKIRQKKLDEFQDKLAGLTFLDPACGSGNFLTETYLSLRRLENEVIRERHHGQSFLGFDEVNPVKVDIHQFYGIEINDFAVTVATTALWISEAQMLAETEKIIHQDINFLPLKSYSNIVEGNALRMDWESVVPKEKLSYIMGNPPFVGYKLQNSAQKADLEYVMPEFGGNIDYVSAWYVKSSELMQQNPLIKAALVSTNSITQGEQVAVLWKPLFEQYGIHIDFAYRTFRWDSEADIKAHVHCVVVGFSKEQLGESKFIYLSNNQTHRAVNINGYLLDAPNVWIEKRTRPLCNAEQMVYGSEPREGGFLILSEEERKELLQESPFAEKWIKRFVGSEDFLNNKIRYCLWFESQDMHEASQSKIIMRRLEECRIFRENSKQVQAHASATTPYLFTSIRQPKTDYLLVPVVSSETRKYIPIGYLHPDVIASNACFTIPNASLYTFGVLMSNVHNAWMRVVCGRLKSDYRYSNTIVYNNFPWPNPTEEQIAKIEQTSQSILTARALYPNWSLSELYKETIMPIELRKAHQENDRAVMAAYGFKIGMTESQCVAELFKMYQELTKERS